MLLAGLIGESTNPAIAAMPHNLEVSPSVASKKSISNTSTLFFPFLFTSLNTANISGNVIDSETGQAISGVKVSIFGLSLATTTDSSGTYLLEAIPLGVKKISFEKNGYISEFETAYIANPLSFGLDIGLVPLPLAPPIIGPNGGIVTQGNVVLNIPPDALTVDTGIIVRRLPQIDFDELVDQGVIPVGPRIYVGPEGLKFKKPITITVPLLVPWDKNGWGVSVPILRFDQATRLWVTEAIGVVDPAAQTITFQLNGFNSFMLPSWADVCKAIAQAITSVSEQSIPFDCENGNECDAKTTLEGSIDAEAGAVLAKAGLSLKLSVELSARNKAPLCQVWRLELGGKINTQPFEVLCKAVGGDFKSVGVVTARIPFAGSSHFNKMNNLPDGRDCRLGDNETGICKSGTCVTPTPTPTNTPLPTNTPGTPGPTEPPGTGVPTVPTVPPP